MCNLIKINYCNHIDIFYIKQFFIIWLYRINNYYLVLKIVLECQQILKYLELY